MANNVVKYQVKRTSVPGRLPNITDSSNSRFIAPGELSLNMADGKLYTTNGTVLIEIGSNVSTINITGGIKLNGDPGANGQVLVSNGSSLQWQSITGFAGTTGFTGSQGITGFTGSQGSAGFVGSRGATGFTGSAGTNGFTGSQGTTGFTGSQGTQGTTGFTGSAGTNGFTGSQGTQGTTGFTGSAGTNGFTGSQGANGFTGSQGTTGFTGSQGTQGTTGFTGSQGATGFTGSAGTNGFTGSAGTNGFTGSAGTNGFTGSQGTQGTTGFTGSAGTNGFTGSQGATGFTGSSVAFTVENNVGLDLSGTVLTTTYNTLISNDVNSVAVGGAAVANAGVWKTKTIVQVLDTILFPDVDPTYTIPTITHTLSVTGTQEIGSTINQLISATVTENDSGIATTIDFRRGATTINTVSSPSGTATTDIAAQFGYADPNNPNLRYTPTYTDNFVVVSGATNWNVRADMSAGLPKKNNKGVTDARAAGTTTSTPQAARTLATFGSTASGISGIYPYFWGKSSTQPTAASIASAIQAGSANKVLGDSTGTITVTYNAAAEYVWLAHVATSTSKTKWYNTALNQGDIGAGQFILAPVLQNVTSPQGFWTAISFKIYISSGATNTSGTLEFRNV